MLILTDSQLSALCGIFVGRGADLSSSLGVRIPEVGEGEAEQNRRSYEQAMYTIPSQAGKVIQHRDAATDLGTLAVDVFPLDFYNDDALVEYAGKENQAVTNDQTNYLYLTSAGVLTLNTTGFPVPSVTPHVPLATVTAADGVITAITDVRERGLFSAVGTEASGLNLLSWQDPVSDELDFTAVEPAAPTLGDRYLNTGTGDSSETAQSVTANSLYEWNGTSWTEMVSQEGWCVYVDDTNALKAFNGSAWVNIGTFALLNEAQTFFAATDISGAQAETLSDGSNADGLHVHSALGGHTHVIGGIITTTGAISFTGAYTLEITLTGATSLTLPTSGTLATQAYVDNVAAGLSPKTSVRAASTGNLTLSGEQTIDGVACVAGDRVLAKDQTATEENGLYDVVDGGAWTRAADADSWAELVSAHVFVEEGTANADRSFVCTVDDGGTLDTTAVTWVTFASILGDGMITAAKLAATLDLSSKTLTLPADLVTAENLAPALDPLTQQGDANSLHVHDVVCVDNETLCYENDLVYT